MSTKVKSKHKNINGANPVLGAVKSKTWTFCNTELQPYPYEWSCNYKCPKCGNHLVNILGTCATKVYY